jgi:hypothetical protein
VIPQPLPFSGSLLPSIPAQCLLLRIRNWHRSNQLLGLFNLRVSKNLVFSALLNYHTVLHDSYSVTQQVNNR